VGILILAASKLRHLGPYTMHSFWLFMRQNRFYGQIASDFKAFTLEIRKKLTRLKLQFKGDLPPFAH